MSDEQIPVAGKPAYRTGRAIMLQLLQGHEDHPQWWTRAELHNEISDIDPSIVDAEVLRLAGVGVVSIDGERMKASTCARYLDALDLIGV